MKRKSADEGDVRCPECGGACEPARIEVSGEEIAGWRCACGYELISPREIEKAYLLMQARKRERVKISKRGNSYMITIPKAIAAAIGIEGSRTAEIYLKDSRTISIKV